MKMTTPRLPVLLLLFILSGCLNLGKEKTYNGVELYHTASVPDTLANHLGKFLVSEKFADGNDKTVQLTESGDTLHFRFVVKAGIEKDSSMAKTTRFFASVLSANVFRGAPVIVEMCDDQMKTLKAFSSSELGQVKSVNGLQLYHTKSITNIQVDSLAKYLVSSKFADGTAKTVQIGKSGNTYQFRFVVKPGADKDPYYLKNAKIFGSGLSAGVFGGAPVEVHMCDDYLNTLVVVPMGDTTKTQ